MLYLATTTLVVQEKSTGIVQGKSVSRLFSELFVLLQIINLLTVPEMTLVICSLATVYSMKV